jgi:hypothetical protein
MAVIQQWTINYFNKVLVRYGVEENSMKEKSIDFLISVLMNELFPPKTQFKSIKEVLRRDERARNR